MAKSCQLRPLGGNHDPIPLLDNTPLNLGRGPVTKIKDSRCSRNQVVLVANFANCKVKTTQLGRNGCGYNGVEMTKDKPIEMIHGQKLDILLGQYSYILEFSPPPDKNSVEIKRKLVNDVSDSEEEDVTAPAKQPRLSASVTDQQHPVTDELWETIGNDLLIYKSPKNEPRKKIAAFDLDGTIITTSSGTTFPKDANDWKIIYPEVLPVLEKAHNTGFKLVIFTNQGSLTNCRNTTSLIRAFQYKVESIVKKLNVPIDVYIAKSKGMVRKPCVGMWNALSQRNGNLTIDLSASYYCGDAAGRLAGITASKMFKNDFSQADVLFARNIGVKFFTPEQLFKGIADTRVRRITAFDYSALPMDLPLCEPDTKTITSNRQELILLVGCPGSGKTTFATTHLVPAGYKRVCRDELRTVDKCLSVAKNFLTNGSHVVVDNTNPTSQSRDPFIQMAIKLNIPVRIFIMKTTLAHAKHNNRFRQLTGRQSEVVGDAVLNSFFQSFEEPTENERQVVSEIVRINFWPTFNNNDNEKLYKQFLSEK